MRRVDEVAPVWRRVCGGAVDAAIGAGAYGVVIGVPVLREMVGGAEDVDARKAIERRMRVVFGEGDAATRRGERVTLAQQLARVVLHDRATPGQRLLGIRWADAATGGPVGWRRTLARELLEFAKRRLLTRVNRPRRARILELQAETRRRAEELEREHADDPEALRRARVAAGGELQGSCLQAMAASCSLGLIEPLTVFLSPRRQSLIDRMAGVVVIRTHPDMSRPSRSARRL